MKKLGEGGLLRPFPTSVVSINENRYPKRHK